MRAEKRRLFDEWTVFEKSGRVWLCGLGWLRRRVCTCRLGSPIHQTDKKWIDFWHFRDFASPTMAHPRCRELCKRAGSLRLAELFRPILFLLLPGSYFFLKLD